MLSLPTTLGALAHKIPVRAVRASFYADKFEGRPMANGEEFHQSEITAASLRFPIGTKVRVRSIRTGKEIIVKITDRGPWGKRYSLDLSKAAFHALGLKLHSGWGWVTVERIDG